MNLNEHYNRIIYLLAEKAAGDPCWKGYKKVGMKMKGGRKVPNCVPGDGVPSEKSVKEGKTTGKNPAATGERVGAASKALQAPGAKTKKTPEQVKAQVTSIKDRMQKRHGDAGVGKFFGGYRSEKPRGSRAKPKEESNVTEGLQTGSSPTQTGAFVAQARNKFKPTARKSLDDFRNQAQRIQQRTADRQVKNYAQRDPNISRERLANIHQGSLERFKKSYQTNRGQIQTSNESKTPAWQRSEGQNKEGGLNAKGRASAKAQGHNLKPPVSAKQAKKSKKSAARRKSFCARMKGMKSKLTSSKTASNPDSRINKSLRKWDC